MRRIYQILGLLILCCILTACVSYKSDRAVSKIQNPEGLELFEQIYPGRTHSGWLLARLGQPSSVTHTNDSTELWRYENIESSEKNISLLPLVKIRLRDQQAQQFWFEVEAGKVIRYWTKTARI